MSLLRDPNARILCPQSMPPVSAEHLRKIEVLNRIYEVADRDADNELEEGQARLYAAAEGEGDWMRAYVDRASGPADGFGHVVVTAAYFRCTTCGFVLPAQVT